MCPWLRLPKKHRLWERAVRKPADRATQVMTVKLQAEVEPRRWGAQVAQSIKTKKHQYGKIQNLKWEKTRIWEHVDTIGFGACFQFTDTTDLLLGAVEANPSSPGL